MSSGRGKGLLGASALGLCLALAAPALAGPPTHSHRDALDITGFDHACGAAVDSEGDVYVSSAGESRVRVFDPAHKEIAFVKNENQPCGLAVDSKGRLYVSEAKTANVVRYTPDAYPLSGAPSYGAAEPIDSSGEAKGISVDPVDDRLYVAHEGGIAVYQASGAAEAPSVEKQSVRVIESTGGAYTLSFRGKATAALKFDATSAEVQTALEALTTIGAGNVSVASEVSGDKARHIVTFTGALHEKSVPQLIGDGSKLTGGTFKLFIKTLVEGFSGLIGDGELKEASGAAAHTFPSGDLYVFAADAASDEVVVFSGPGVKQLELRRTIAAVDHDHDPKTPEQAFGFASTGGYLAVDPGNSDPGTKKCASVDEQACTAGHLLLYDEAHKAIDELEASGEFLDQLSDEALADSKPTALALDRSGGTGDGTIYATSGAGAGSKLLAFDPLAAPSRPPLAALSHEQASAKAVATDSFGNVYLAAGSFVHVYGPDGVEIEVGLGEGKGFQTETAPWDLAVDSDCNVYVQRGPGFGGNPADHKVQHHTPASCPPEDGTQYSAPVTVATGNSFKSPASISAIGLNPANDRIFVASQSGQMLELGSAAEKSPILDPCFACGLNLTIPADVAVCGANGRVYVPEEFKTIRVIDPAGTEVVARIEAAGSPKGLFEASPGAVAVDQASCHVLVFRNGRGAAEEYDAAGGFVSRFGSFSTKGTGYGIAIDNSGGPANGNVYVAFDDPAIGVPDLSAFGPLTYGEAPQAITGLAVGLGGGNATLNGTVNPRGFAIEECRFDYLGEATYLANGKGFAGASEAPCAETPAQIGKGTLPIAVHADLSGLDREARYRFRLAVEGEFGPSTGKAGLFGPPVLTPKAALPVLYDEATLRAQVDPSGLTTKYRFEYGTTASYGQSTPEVELPAGDGPVAIAVPLTGLAEGTEYHFRLLAQNEALSVQGEDQTLVTLARAKEQSCPNTPYRTGLSANLPECRAYELVTPAETRGSVPYAEGPGTAGEEFNNWLTRPRGAGAGESVAYFALTLPGTEGTGKADGYRAKRGEGEHPIEGWANELIGPTYAEAGGEGHQHGIAADQLHGFFDLLGETASFDRGRYLRTPAGFEPIGRGSLGADLDARGRFLSAGGAHVVFASEAHLEEDAAPAGTLAVYDRAAGFATAEVVSVKADGEPFAAGEGASYVGASEDATAIAFRVGGTLYLHRGGETFEVAPSPNAFAGIASDGRVFYASGSGFAPGTLYACEVEAGPCTEPPARTEIASDAVFVNVSPDGSGALFTSEDDLTGTEENEAGEEAEAGEPNLYSWDGAATSFVAILDPADFESFDGYLPLNLLRWTRGMSAGVEIGRANSPTRATPDGEVFLFQSHAKLSPYDNEGHGEVYRYEPGAKAGKELLCLSCDPSGAPSSADDLLQVVSFGGVTSGTTLLTNVTDDGQAAFFQSPDRLLPEDANEAIDVYGWKAQGAGGCERPGGCLALISSGQGEEGSFLYGMSADGQDVIFETPERLVAQDVPGSPSLYDARIEGGIPDPPKAEQCQGDACQGQGSTPPALPSAASAAGLGEGNVTEPPPRPRCPKGKRRVRRQGQVRCVKRRGRHGQRHR